MKQLSDSITAIVIVTGIFYFCILLPIIAASMKERCRKLGKPISAEAIFVMFKGSKLWMQAKAVQKDTDDEELKKLFHKTYIGNGLFFLFMAIAIFTQE